MSLQNEALNVFSLRSFIRAGNGGKWRRRTVVAIKRNFAGATADHIHELVEGTSSGLKFVTGRRTGKLYVEAA